MTQLLDASSWRGWVVAVNASVNGVAEAPRGVDDRLVWIDLEMTGLDVDRHRIVEIAVLVTDAQLEVLADGLDLVVHQPPEALADMDDFVRKMHTKSGLLPAIEQSSLTLEAAGKQAIEYITQFVPEPGTAPMCGNSIGVDRRFLDRYLPDLDRYLHYRSIDVSSLKELCRRWYPEAYRKRPSKSETHRALDDIRESVAELRYYRATIMQPPPPPPAEGKPAVGG
jgi:oligoribonuclease